MKIAGFVIWLFAGIITMVSGPSTLTYGLCWGVLMLRLLEDVIEDIMNLIGGE